MSIQRYIFVLLFSSISTSAFPAGFDCQQAKLAVEKAICTNTSLSNLDDALTRYYKNIMARQSGSEREVFKSEQGAWLHQRNAQCEISQNKASCLFELYKKRLMVLRREYDKPFMPDQSKTSAMCREIANLDKTARASFGADGRIADVNNDGENEVAEVCSGGTMHAPCVEYRNGQGQEIDIKSFGFEWNDYGTFGLRVFWYDGKVFRLHSYDDYFEKPAFVSYITADNNEYILCEFDNKPIEKIIARSTDPNEVALCNVLEKNSAAAGIVRITLNQTSELNNDDVRRAKRSETAIGGTATIDYDNDGVPNTLVELQYASGAGRGCDYNYFDELSEDQHGFSNSMMRNLLVRMQDVNFSNRHPNCGGMGNRFFTYMGKTYYQKMIKKQQKVMRIESQKSHEICAVDESIETRLKRAGIITLH